MHKRRNISRRRFLGEASCAALGSTTFLSSVLNLGMINTAAARPHIIGNPSDYKAMVCILLSGGVDSHNVLIPTETSQYSEYQTTRGDLALDINANPAEILPLNYNNNGQTFGVHAGMPDVRDMFDNGDLSFIANIGTLIEPIADASDYYSGSKKIPLGLYSHSDQIMQWQTSVPQDRSAVGVGGKMADLLHSMNSIPGISMNISLDGKNRFQSGNNIVEYSIQNDATPNNIGITGFPSWWSNSGFLSMTKDSAIGGLVEDVYSNIFQETFGDISRQNIESTEIFKTALANVLPLNTTFSSATLSQDLKMMAEVISVRSHLGACRQIFFTSFGGWDHHDDVLTNQANMLPVLNDAMKEFNDAMVELGLHNDVVTFTISDFARTLTSNGNGSDHAWGGNQMIMGGAINGGDVFGTYPSLNLNGPLNLSDRGRILPTTSVDEFYAELAIWFGVSLNDLDYILPNLCNFYSTTGCPQDPPANYMPIGMF
ncbi:MAG: DUF1501 domain-containing protein [Bacteroidia bacterium]|nr:DUF1501 domain-containing protein [Bacteroidia bacterium]